jgi:hypothetical protein
VESEIYELTNCVQSVSTPIILSRTSILVGVFDRVLLTAGMLTSCRLSLYKVSQTEARVRLCVAVCQEGQSSIHTASHVRVNNREANLHASNCCVV